jgi:hypothetical protein
MRHAILLTVLLSLALLNPAVVSPVHATSKKEVVIYQYEGVAEGVTKAKFGMFRGILKNKLNRMKRELPEQFDHIEELQPKFQDRPTSMSADRIQLWLKNQASVLCLLTGTIFSEDGKNYLVISNFYLGELKEHIPDDPVMIPLQIKLDEFGNIQDSHSVVIFYALAMEAKRRHLDKHLVAHFLSMAKNNMADIQGRSDALYADLDVLWGAIDKAEKELRGEE